MSELSFKIHKPEVTHTLSDLGSRGFTVENAIQLLNEELEDAKSLLKDGAIIKGPVISAIQTLLKNLTGMTKRQRKIAENNSLNSTMQDEKSIPRNIIPLVVKPKNYRNMLFDRGNVHCKFCRRKLTRTTATIDHVVPVTRGGTNAPDNLIIACEQCNQTKAGRTLEEWIEDLESALNKRSSIENEV